MANKWTEETAVAALATRGIKCTDNCILLGQNARLGIKLLGAKDYLRHHKNYQEVRV